MLRIYFLNPGVESSPLFRSVKGLKRLSLSGRTTYAYVTTPERELELKRDVLACIRKYTEDTLEVEENVLAELLDR